MINYIKGDATLPQGDGRKIIAHVCNNVGAWGAGFVLAISARDKVPESAYRLWSKGAEPYSKEDFILGQIQLISFDIVHQPLTWVCNMIAQDDTGWGSSGPPIRYGALASCLAKLNTQAKFGVASVHMPRIGCGLAGGDWNMVSALINRYLTDVPVTVYDYEQPQYTGR
jgi:O-acetyl-ADP-ribose deacetylase (regulator of RNase III)